MKHRILLHTNPPWIKTGLAENARTLLKYLYKTGKYEVAEYCSQTSIGDPNLNYTPWKSYGSIPTDPRIIHELQQDQGRMRDVAYGSWNIDNVIKDFQPTIWIGSDDIWAFSKGSYIDKPWFKVINSILHITVDSLPILDQAYEQALFTKHYVTWAKFAMNEMKRHGPRFSHVTQIYGAMDTEKFSPISEEERLKLRRMFGITDDTFVFLFVGRNQLRKQFVQCLNAFAQFKRENLGIKAKLHFHTSFSEKAMGWDIPKMTKYYGLKEEDVLCTYVCKQCGQWAVSPYRGEDVDCPFCKSSKSMITANIVNGVPEDQMKYLYGISDGCISAFSSGGQEYHSVQSLLCAKPLACTNYSCGKDFCEQPFVDTLRFSEYVEHGNNFIKSTTEPRDIVRFMAKVCKMSKRDRQEWGNQGRLWAKKVFSIETIGAQWEALFDSLPFPDYSKIDWVPQLKNDNFPMPQGGTDDEFLTILYKEVLKMDEPPDGKGRADWHAAIKSGRTRESIYDFFISVARSENNKYKSQDFWTVIDKSDRKRGLILIKESIGDVIIVTSLFKSFHEQHPDTDLYVMVDDKYRSLIEDNPFVHKVLSYNPSFEQEMLAIGSGTADGYFHYYYHTAIQTQRLLSYLSQPTPAFDLNYANSN